MNDNKNSGWASIFAGLAGAVVLGLAAAVVLDHFDHEDAIGVGILVASGIGLLHFN
jgi:hypothetical protein